MIVVRVLGLMLCAMAVQFMLTGLAGSTMNLVRGDTATPYQHDKPSPTTPSALSRLLSGHAAPGRPTGQ